MPLASSLAKKLGLRKIIFLRLHTIHEKINDYSVHSENFDKKEKSESSDSSSSD